MRIKGKLLYQTNRIILVLVLFLVVANIPEIKDDFLNLKFIKDRVFSLFALFVLILNFIKVGRTNTPDFIEVSSSNFSNQLINGELKDYLGIPIFTFFLLILDIFYLQK